MPQPAPQNLESASACAPEPLHPFKETDMAWTKPQATDLRYGFEITMYISNR